MKQPHATATRSRRRRRHANAHCPRGLGAAAAYDPSSSKVLPVVRAPLVAQDAADLTDRAARLQGVTHRQQQVVGASRHRANGVEGGWSGILDMKAGGEARTEEFTPQISIDVPILIPEQYVPDLDLRMGLYRRLGDLEDRQAIDAFAAEMIDRFGTLQKRPRT